jgi:hypothetical protein
MLKALIVAALLFIPISAKPDNNDITVTGYILIAQACDKEAEWLMLVFSDGSFVYIRVADIHSDWYERLAVVRQNMPLHQVIVRGPYDGCPTVS